MKKIDLHSRIQNFDNVVRIDNDFILVEVNNRDNPDFPNFSYLQHPHKLETTTINLMLEGGEMAFNLDLKEYEVAAPCMITYLPDQILQYAKRGKDYDVRHIHFSRKFIDNMTKYFKDYSLFSHLVKNQPAIALTKEDLNEFLKFFDKAKEVVLDVNNPYRMDIIIHLSALFFYEILSRIKIKPDETFKSNRCLLVNNFLDLVRDNHMEHRELSFYAEKLCLTTKYLTTIIKRETGISAADWIERYVILQAKALLKSTDLTIQQISDKLNFSSQVFFGKYFKRLVGMPPKEYRKTL